MNRTEKYLYHYAERDIAAAQHILGQWDYGLVIPACEEGQSLLKLLTHLDSTVKVCRVLVLIVINGRIDAKDTTHHQNARCDKDIRSLFPISDASPLLRGQNIDIHIVDRFSPDLRLGPKEGVGLARKIGCDILAALYQTGQITQGWAASTDADALLPSSYFETLGAHRGSLAITYPFQHVPVAGFERSIALYELSLHHYVLGLEWARSPYAFHTIGSTIGFSIEAYIASRGFPKRLAGEDFYFLNKVAKLGPVSRVAGEPILLEARPSTRVPFGTGPALLNIQKNEGSFHFYNPQIFSHLRSLLSTFSSGAECPDQALLHTLGFSAIQMHLERQPTQHRRTKHLHDWFDGFKTLKYIHALRDSLYPNLTWKEALTQSPWGSVPLPNCPILALEVVRKTAYVNICGSTPAHHHS